MTFDAESFFVGMLAGMVLFGVFGKIALAWAHKRMNPYEVR